RKGVAGKVLNVAGFLTNLYGMVSSGFKVGKNAYGRWVVTVVRAVDPNEKVGPVGSGDGNHVIGDKPFSYAVLFENMAEATAPAQSVIITDQLDADAFDLSTFQFGSAIFGERIVSLPPVTDVTVATDLRP